MIQEIYSLDRVLVVIKEGRPVTEQEKRFNLLKSEQEEEDNSCESCYSPDYIDTIDSHSEAKASPYIRQGDLGTGDIMYQFQADLYQEIREIKDITRTCLFCGAITQEKNKGQYIERKVGVQHFSNATKSTVTFSATDITSTDNVMMIYNKDSSNE